MKLGVISDTHGLLRPEATKLLTGVEQILHAGDIGHADVISGLREIAPVTAIKGNIDIDPWADEFPQTIAMSLAGQSIYVLHNLKDLTIDPAAQGHRIVISGHSHQPRIETINNVLYLNPGSAGPRRFKLPIALAILHLTPDSVEAQIHEITP